MLRKLAAAALSAVIAIGVVSPPAHGANEPSYDKQASAKWVAAITKALPDKAPATPKKARKVLIFTLATGYVHSSIPVGAKAFELLGEKTGAYTSVTSHDSDMFAPEKLKDFDAVVMMSTTGDLFGLKPNQPLSDPKISDAQRQHIQMLRDSFVDFVKSGHGLVGVHAATDCSYKWPEYGDMIGAYFLAHPFQHAVYRIEDPSNPITACFGTTPFSINDETYTFRPQPYSREKLHILASIDCVASNISHGNRADNDYALAWIHQYGKGHVFYAAHGHREDVYGMPKMLQFYLAGMQYALGDLEANDAPSGPLKEPRPMAQKK
jgi:hypothetical protein